MLKFSLYIFSAIVVVFAMDGVNINAIFKKNQVIKARLCYFIIILCMTYLLANFIYDFTTVLKFK